MSISFYNTLQGKIEETISDIHYEKLCSFKKDVFEVIHDDKPVKLYFDADYVFYNESEFKIGVANELLNLNKIYLTRAIVKTLGIQPEFAVAESHSNGRIKQGKNVWGYSFHIVIPNVVAFKKDIKVFTEVLNKEIMENQKYETDPISDYIEITDDFKPFDTSVYNNGIQKFRTVHSSKDGENRPFNLIEGTFNDMCITGFIGDNVKQFIPEKIAVICNNNILESVKTTVRSDKKDDMLFVKLALDKEMLLSRSKDTEKWMATSMFIKGYFGDNTESIELFHTFSKLYHSKYDERTNMEKWNGFVTNEKYDSFGIFVNWCKEENKEKCKDIKNEIKQINKDNNEKMKKDNKDNNEKMKKENNEKKNNEKEQKINEKLSKNNEKEQKIKDKQTQIDNVKQGDALFTEMSAKFELEHTKIINGSIYVKTDEEKVIFMSRRDMIISYEHIQCGLNRLNNPVSFIEKWLVNNSSINVKLKMDIYPDTHNCPQNVFNLWRPFEMEKYITPYNKHEEELTMILKHIMILCGNNKIMYKYFISWISKMIQQPEIKLTCMVFISQQGAGKGTLLHLFSLMLGKTKVFETTDPARDVWGNFNDLMTDAFLVNINELEYTDAKNGDSKLKALVTDPDITINPKGQKPIRVKSHHHFIITTNKENPIPVEKGNRRFVVVKSSDELCKNTEYFKTIYTILENNDVVRTVYDYFKNYDISEFIHTEFPVSEYLEDLQELNKSAPELWLKDFTIQHEGEETVERLGSEIYIEFLLWCNTNNYRYETNPIKLALKIKNLNIDGVEKGRPTKKGNTKIFNINKMKRYFDIGCLVEL